MTKTADSPAKSGEVVKTAPIKLEPGMLILSDPATDPMGPRVYAVRSRRVLISFQGGIKAESTLTESGLPDGWVLLDPEKLAKLLSGEAILSQVAAA